MDLFKNCLKIKIFLKMAEYIWSFTFLTWQTSWYDITFSGYDMHCLCQPFKKKKIWTCVWGGGGRESGGDGEEEERKKEREGKMMVAYEYSTLCYNGIIAL